MMDGPIESTDAVTKRYVDQCPEAVSVWRFKLRGRACGRERIFNWKFEGSNDNINWVTLYSTKEDYLGNELKTYDIDNNNSYVYYRIFALNAENTNPGLRYWQLYTYLL